MSTQINLLTQIQGPRQQVLKITKIARIAAVVLTIIFVVFGSFVFYQSFEIDKNFKRSEEAIKDIENKITQEKAVESKYLLYAKKIEAVDSIINDRLSPFDSITKLEEAIPEGVLYKNLVLDKKDVSFDIESNSLDKLKDLIDNLTIDLKLNPKKITMLGLKKSGSTYSASFNLNLIIESQEEIF